ncbi:MAG: hypothetical protein AAGF12_34235 [Myxococcota bacterium]
MFRKPLQFYLGDTEVGTGFAEYSLALMGEIRDRGILHCMPL